MAILKERNTERNAETNRFKDELYGLLLVELDSVYGETSYVLAYGDLIKVQRYKEECNLKGDIREYKTRSWLVKRLESIHEKLKNDVKILYVE